jgi:multiple sugar transport system ATP-binding protein
MADVILDDVTKVYSNGTVAVDGLDLEVPDGSLQVIVGPSGCGKTTLLRLVSGLDRRMDGRILIGGQDVTGRSPKDRDVAMVFQTHSLYPHMSVYDNMAFGIRVRGTNKAQVDERVQRVADVLGLRDLLKRKPWSLSGGQKQRVAIGRAIVRHPQAFLLDEPLSDLDTRMRAQLRSEIAHIQQEFSVTTLYVTHDQGEAMLLGDKVAVMRAGALEQVDHPRAIYEHPANLFVAGFIGSPPMNLAEATLEEEGGGPSLRFGSHRLAIDAATLAARPRLRTYVGRQVVMGIRPEDIQLPGQDTPEGALLHVTVSHRELVGADVYLHFVVDALLLLEEDPRDPELGEVDGGPWPAERANVFLAKVGEASAASQGDRVDLAVRPGKVHLFDPKTGESIED